jgi:hypothetical protein
MVQLNDLIIISPKIAIIDPFNQWYNKFVWLDYSVEKDKRVTSIVILLT